MTEILSGLIQAFGTMIAAVIGVYYAGRIVKKSVVNYSDEENDLRIIMRKAKKSIIIIANCADGFLERYCDDLQKYMRNGVQINFLLLDMENYAYMDRYITGKEKADYAALKKSLKYLQKLKEFKADKLCVRVFHSYLTASYICVDLEKNPQSGMWADDTIIHMMLYQFNTRPCKSPIMYVSPKDKEKFNLIAESVYAIWDSAATADIAVYLKKVMKKQK